jgi:hypothetical protein
MTSNLLTNPQYWRDRAEEIRVLAERSVHAETKRMLETIVADYELLALRAEERLRGSKPVGGQRSPVRLNAVVPR